MTISNGVDVLVIGGGDPKTATAFLSPPPLVPSDVVLTPAGAAPSDCKCRRWCQIVLFVILVAVQALSTALQGGFCFVPGWACLAVLAYVVFCVSVIASALRRKSTCLLYVYAVWHSLIAAIHVALMAFFLVFFGMLGYAVVGLGSKDRPAASSSDVSSDFSGEGSGAGLIEGLFILDVIGLVYVFCSFVASIVSIVLACKIARQVAAEQRAILPQTSDYTYPAQYVEMSQV